MSALRLALATAVTVAPFGCTKKPQTPAVVVVDDSAQQDSPGDGGGGAAAEGDEAAKESRPDRTARKPPSGKPIRVRASLHGAGDLMTLVKQATSAWTPKQPIDPAAQAQAILLQLGYGPGLWASLDLAGPFAVDASFFPNDESAAGLQLAGSLAVLSAKGVMEAMPSAQRPQPLGNGMWELIQGELRVLLREQAKSLEFALSPDDLARAAGLAGEAAQGRRFQLRATDLPPGYIGSGSFAGLPDPLRRPIASVLRDATAATLELDAGTDRDLVLQAAADAPFSRLGLTFVGAPSTQSSPLEASLPERPALVIAVPWGSPGVLHSFLDKGVRLDQIPAPFDKAAGEAIAGAHAVLDQVASDVLFAVYLTPKGDATFVLAANVKDEAAARAAVRSVQGAAYKGLEAFNSVTGDDKAAKLGLSLKLDAKAGHLKADLLSIGLPKNMAKEVDELAPFLSKGKFEALTLVSGSVAIFAAGANAQATVADVAAGLKASRKTSLGADAGLRLARAASTGCHFCVGIDPAALILFAARLGDSPEPARLKKLEAAAATFARLGGAVGVGLRIDPKRGSLGVGLPRSVLVPAPGDAAVLAELWADDPATAKAAAADKPLAGKPKG